MHIDPGGSSSATPSYFLASKPPIKEINKQTFRDEVKAFYNDDMTYIANNPEEYSKSVSRKAKLAAEVAQQYGHTRDSEGARYFSYQLGRTSVGLLRTEVGFSMTEFGGDGWREKFPGRTEITSIVDFRVTHPLVDNAGDILLEHQLRICGEYPLLNSRSANKEAKVRAIAMGFVEVDDSSMVLDPTQSNKWMKNSADEWQRADKPQLYLSKEDSVVNDSESAARLSTYSDDDDFM
ncbi:effector protein NopP [Mesorhizobium sp. USDA 4775]